MLPRLNLEEQCDRLQVPTQSSSSSSSSSHYDLHDNHHHRHIKITMIMIIIMIIIYSSRGHTALPPLIPMDATTLHLDGNNLGNVLLRQVIIVILILVILIMTKLRFNDSNLGNVLLSTPNTLPFFSSSRICGLTFFTKG